MEIPEKIFKAYDIRGLVETELSADLAYRVGRYFAEYLKKQLPQAELAGQAVVLGYDMRLSSLEFHAAAMRGVCDAGLNVVDIGLTSTPLFNFACAHYPEHAGGIMVTASHNPAEYNGFKMTLGNGLPVPGVALRDCRTAIFLPPERVGSVSAKDVFNDYKSVLFKLVEPSHIAPLRIVVDAGNGMAKVTLPRILQSLPIEVEYLYLEPDGRFPNHEANPLKEDTLRDLQQAVVKNLADFGFALDGDCDRFGLVDEQGHVVESSYVGALLGLEVLRNHPGATMLYDLRSSQIVPEVWQAAGAGTVSKCPVGHANIKKLMKENNAQFGSELSLHLYFHDLYDLECSDFALLYLLRLLTREQRPLSQIVAPFKKYFHSGEINFEVEDKEAAVKRVETYYQVAACETSRLDGLWMGFEWGWFNVRASNTEPVLRLNLEAATFEMLAAERAELTALITDNTDN